MTPYPYICACVVTMAASAQSFGWLAAAAADDDLSALAAIWRAMMAASTPVFTIRPNMAMLRGEQAHGTSECEQPIGHVLQVVEEAKAHAGLPRLPSEEPLHGVVHLIARQFHEILLVALQCQSTGCNVALTRWTRRRQKVSSQASGTLGAICSFVTRAPRTGSRSVACCPPLARTPCYQSKSWIACNPGFGLRPPQLRRARLLRHLR